MKKLLLAFMAIFLVTMAVMAQDEEEEGEKKGFKKENLFTGGSISLSFFNGQTLLGANPIFGYKLADWVDAGLAFNYVYSSTRDYFTFDDKVRQTTWGPGAFVRLYPVHFLFVQGQFEHNFITQKYIPPNDGQIEKYKTGVNSLLLGGGIVQGRREGSNTFYYISLLFDVLKNDYSPYVNVSVNRDNPSQQRIDMAPIIRAGVNIGLFEHRYK
jgi:hypothetical protein